MQTKQPNTNKILATITIASILYGLYSQTYATYSDKTMEIENAISSANKYKYTLAKDFYTNLDKYNSTIVGTCESLPESMQVDCNKLAINSNLPSRAEVGEFFSIKKKIADDALPSWSGSKRGSGNLNQEVSVGKSECPDYERNQPIEWVELHYTATSTWTQLNSILNGHKARFGSDYIGYHYVITYWGEIYNTRADNCVASADKEHKNNWRFIQVSFIGSDKPSDAQKKAIKSLIKTLSNKYEFPITSVTSHHDEASYKSKNESLNYWFWSKENFLNYLKEEETKVVNKKVIITRNWWNDPRVQYGYEISNWDLDFIRTVEAESKWDINAVWDSGQSVGLCQFHKGFNPWLAKEYLALKDDLDKVKFCYDYYLYASTLPLWVWSRLHGYKVRNLKQNSSPFVIIGI